MKAFEILHASNYDKMSVSQLKSNMQIRKEKDKKLDKSMRYKTKLFPFLGGGKWDAPLLKHFIKKNCRHHNYGGLCEKNL